MKKIKKIIIFLNKSFNPYYELNKQAKTIENIYEKLISSQLDSRLNELERLRNMSEEDIKNEKEKILNIEATKILTQLECNPELYRVFNNILRINKFKKIEDSKNE